MTRTALHAKAVTVAKQTLGVLPLDCEIRGAVSHLKPQTVVSHGKRYAYEYARYHWNLHSKGVRRVYPAVWVLVGWHKRTVSVWKIPGHLLRGLTVQMLVNVQTPRSILHRYRVA